MTLEEYEQRVSNALVAAHNNKDIGALTDTFRTADQVLENSSIGPTDRKKFWEEVGKVIYSGRLRLEKQANSALIVLMQTIEKEIAARTGKTQ